METRDNALRKAYDVTLKKYKEGGRKHALLDYLRLLLETKSDAFPGAAKLFMFVYERVEMSSNGVKSDRID
jgi:hypothetical protein